MLGIVATKRLGNAVQRNRAKRIVRELYRKHKSLFPQSSQSVIIPKRAIFKLKHSELECSFLGAIEKASIKL